jgi:cytochrome d ubiquinol oxidase subunit II
LNTTNAASTHYTLTVMTWVAVALTPVVVLYQGYTYWVYRRRISAHHIPVRPAFASPRDKPTQTAV